MTIVENIKSMISKTNNVKSFMKLAKSMSYSDAVDKLIDGILIGILTTLKFDSSRIMHEHLTKMINITIILRPIIIKIDESFLMTFIMDSLPPQYGQFQINYNTIKDKWNMIELQTLLI